MNGEPRMKVIICEYPEREPQTFLVQSWLFLGHDNVRGGWARILNVWCSTYEEALELLKRGRG